MSNDRATLGLCLLTLVSAAASAFLHFSPIYIAIPAIAAVVCAMRTPVRTLVDMFFGGRR
ncbi:MAG TPA: hypothetical protein VHX39_33350 [Acetobacteraceae bacterium]|nr:hypothetical protein [Acetobacteraceae bacterium]